MWLSSITLLPWLPGAFLHRRFPPQSPPSHPQHPSLHSQQQCSPWDCSTIPKLQFPAAVPSRGPSSLSRVCMAVARTVWFSIHLGCHLSAVSLSALNVSPLTHCPNVGIRSLLQFPHLLRAGPVLWTLLFSPLVPSSYWVARGSLYSFPLVRYSCPLSDGVLDAILCLKVYSWCMRGERYTPHPPTPLPSYSSLRWVSCRQYIYIHIFLDLVSVSFQSICILLRGLSPFIVILIYTCSYCHFVNCFGFLWVPPLPPPAMLSFLVIWWLSSVLWLNSLFFFACISSIDFWFVIFLYSFCVCVCVCDCFKLIIS